jgi:hypothetical protein
MGGVLVEFEDLDGRTFDATTNSEGNFMISIGDESLPDEGWSAIDFEPHFPVRVRISQGPAFDEEMRSDIPREGSCAACHSDPADEDSVGKVVLKP